MRFLTRPHLESSIPLCAGIQIPEYRGGAPGVSGSRWQIKPGTAFVDRLKHRGWEDETNHVFVEKRRRQA
jgi:hypothetical protein